MKITSLGAGRYALAFAYHPRLVELAKSIPGLTWDKDRKAWCGYVDACNEFLNALPEKKPLKLGDPPALEDFPSKLREYQKTGISFLVDQAHQGAILADVMGLGKSVQALFGAMRLGGRFLIVCPSFVRGVWKKELQKWCPDHCVLGLEGLKPIDTRELEVADVVVCHYDIVHAHIEALFAWGIDTIIIDEAHFLSNEKARRSVAVKELAHSAKNRIALTGTPLTNRPKDLWNVVDTVSPGRFGSFFKYAMRHCCPPEAPIWMGDLSEKPIGDVRVGDVVIGWATPQATKRGKATTKQRLCRSRVVAVGRRAAPVVKITLASGRTVRCTADHRWLSGKHYSKRYPYVVAKVGRHLTRLTLDLPDCPQEFRETAAWLGGIFDGEGCHSGHSLTIAQSRKHNPDVCAAIESALARLGFKFTVGNGGHKGMRIYHVSGGRSEVLRFLKWCRPVRSRKIREAAFRSKFRQSDEIVSIEADGTSEVVSLTTTTGNYVVWGYGSKNCDAHQDIVGQGEAQKAYWNFDGASNLDELKRRLGYFMLRRTHDDPDVRLELPAKTRQVVELKVPPANRLAITRSLGAKDIRRALDIAADGKLSEVASMLRQHVDDGLNVVCFCYRRSVAERLAEECGGEYIHGDVPFKERERRIDEHRSKGAGLLVATIDCVSVGIDLSHSSVGVFAELTYEPTELAQAEARLHRPGATKPVLIQYVVALGTVDELVRQACIEKLSTIEKTIGDPDALAKGLSGPKSDEDALKELFEALD